MRHRSNGVAIALLLFLAGGCAIRVGQSTHSPTPQVASASTPYPIATTLQGHFASPVPAGATPPETVSQPADPGAILTCDCLERP